MKPNKSRLKNKTCNKLIRMRYVFLALFTLTLALSFDLRAQQETLTEPAPNTYPKTQNKMTDPNAPKRPVRKVVRIKKHTLIIGPELRHYKYEEPGFVTHDGFMYGGFAEYYYKFSNMSGGVGIGGNFLYGALNYDGGLCDTLGNCVPYKATTNDIIARLHSRLNIEANSNLSFQAGLGLRYLNDQGQGVGFYQRTGLWFYFPVAAVVKIPLANKSNLKFNLEYDSIFSGGLRSNLSEVDSSYTDVYKPQNGYGLIFSTSYDWSDYRITAFYESWSLNESAPVQSGGDTFIEPKNQSQSFGLQLAMQIF